MSDRNQRAVAIVGVGAILPDAPAAPAFRDNVWHKRYSITEVPPERWSLADYYDPDPSAPDKSYSKIGAWVRGFEFDWKRFHVPPRVAATMDESQQWAVTIAAEALADYGYPDRKLDLERTGVVLGTAMGGELSYLTTLRICFPEFARALEGVSEFRELPAPVRQGILARWQQTIGDSMPPITEDTMPGELANIVSGRVANILNLRGPNFITDAACASSLAALDVAVDLVLTGHCDAVIAGGVDRNMGVNSFVKFCKIGALSATGTRPFGEGADGFVMGEGSAAFLLRRLADAERDGDRVYAVVRGVGGSSDGKGKAITAPNPIGQQLAIRRAWEDAGLDPATATLIEAHGTSTKVGDLVEVESLASVFGGARPGSIALGSAKSNVGHLKAGAGAAGLLKAVYALHEKVLPPTLHAVPPNPDIDFSRTPFALSHELREWAPVNGQPRRAGVSAYGFGGTNFHVVLEEHQPGLLTQPVRPAQVSVPAELGGPSGSAGKPPLRGLALLGAATPAALTEKVDRLLTRVKEGFLPPVAVPDPGELAAPERLAVDFGDGGELAERLQKARKALLADAASSWRALQSQGIFRGRGPRPGKVAFLFTGQGSQYANMGRELAEREPTVAAVFAEADRVMAPILGRPLTGYLFVDARDLAAVEQAEQALMQTAITQPAVLTMDTAVCRLLAEYGFRPDLVMGHSLGEYGALVAAEVLPFGHALEAAAARGREMTRVSLGDNGWLAAVMAPLAVVEETLAQIDGYVVPANINARGQCVVGGEGDAVARAIEAFAKQGYPAQRLPVSHAFHTRIVAPAAEPLRKVLDRLSISPPSRPLVANATADFYPSDTEAIKDLLVRQIASPVQFVAGLEKLYASGVRTFVEVGPKRALKGFVDDVLGDREGVVSLFTNRPQPKELSAFNQALCGLYAAGYGGREAEPLVVSTPAPAQTAASAPSLEGLTRLLTQAIEHLGSGPRGPYDRNQVPVGSIVVSGTGLGLPGTEKPVMDPTNAGRILRGEQFVDLIPERFRALMAGKHVTRLVKSDDGGGHFETIEDTSEVIKLAARPGPFDLSAEYGVPEKLVEALDITSQLAMAAGLDALREAGIPLLQTYRKTSTGKHLPERWLLPEALRDETGVIFASAFPGYDRLSDEFHRYYTYESRRSQRQALEDLRRHTQDPGTLREIQRRAAELDELLAREPYSFDRRFLLRVLTMGHSQFAEYIGARGPNAHVNAACASTPQAVGLAEDWIRSGRCRRVVVIGADNVTGSHLLEWIGAGFLATGAAATDAKVEEAALPFDRRRHGTLLGMGACALLLESQDAVEERGMRGIVELLATEVRNSAHHATRLDVQHIAGVMDSLVISAERRFGLSRQAMAPETVFMSHETFTPARGGSASAEVAALRRTFGVAASEIVVANTKGFTGHPMGVGIEDVIAVKILEHGIVPPVPNLREPDPELGELNLSRGGRYPVKYAIHLAAGFGSQIALTLIRRIPGGLDRTDQPALHQKWLADVSGYDRAETEVVKRVLRVVAQGAPPRQPVPSRWTYGIGPSRRATAPGDDGVPEPRPAPPAPPPARSVAAPAPPAPPPLPVVAAVAPAPPPPTPPAAPGRDPVTQKVLAIVAEKTGYPPDMLDLDLDLEADLGVDTVKQAETFAAVREAYDIPRQENLKLRDFPTLKHVVQFVFDRRPELAAATAPAAPSTAPAPDATAAAPAAGCDPVTQKVLAIVAEKTGYPPDMLDLDLDLEADLGVDTVKQAETFAAVREAYDIPRQENLKLRDFPTLKHVVQFVFDRRPELAAAAAAPPTPVAPSLAAPLAAPLPPAALPRAASLEDADRMPRRVPVPCLRPSLDLCKPTGVVLGGQSRVVVMSDQDGAGQALGQRLLAGGATVLALDAALEAADLEARLRAWSAEGKVQGVFWLPALDAEPPLAELDLPEFRELNRRRVKSLYATMRTLYEQVAGAGSFLVAATRMGGLHGQGAEGATNPLGGAVAGFTKAFKREQLEALVKVVDFEPTAAPAEIAEALLAETLADPGVVEVGYHDRLRFTIGLEERPAADGRPGLTLGPDSVFVVTGAAGGITSAIVADLAAASGGVFYLLDLVPEPRRDDPQIALLRAHREQLKLALIEDMKARGERPTPVLVDKQILAVERSEAALRAMEAVEAAGGTVHYRSVNLLDGPAVAAVVDEVRANQGRIDVLLHAGGVEISRKLSEKEPKEFDLVFDIKADGFFSLLRAAEGMPLGATVVFSSVAGRFGNSGQADYSAANALLCSLSSHLRRVRPGTRSIAIDWTAWGGIGMATRGSIPAIMQMAGIEMLPPEAGVPTLRRELTVGGGSGELVVAGRLGILGLEWDLTGGLDPAKINALLAARERPLLMIGSVKSARLYGGLIVETTLDPRLQPFLFDHQIEGTPLLPGVMGTEAFAELASILCPGYAVAAIEDEEFLLPFKFFRRQPATLHLSATAQPAGTGELLVHAVLRSVVQPKPELPVQERIHFLARVRMSRQAPSRPLMAFEPPPPEGLSIGADAVYRVYFHGPAYRVIERAGIAGETAIGLMAAGLPPNTVPDSADSLTAPRLLELCFQTAGLWLLVTKQVMALPAGLRRATLYRQPESAGAKRLYAVVTAVGEGAEFDARVADEDGDVYLEASGYRTVPLPGRTVLG